MFIDFRKRETERKRERETLISCFPTCVTWDQTCHIGTCLTKDGTHDLLVYWTMLQPTEPPGQGSIKLYFNTKPSK